MKELMENINNIHNLVTELSVQVTENYDKFIFDTIRPYCEEVTEQVVEKKDLSNALVNYFGTDARKEKECPRCGKVTKENITGRHFYFCYNCGMKIKRYNF